MGCVEKAIKRAWSNMKEHQPDELDSCEEEEVTRRLCHELGEIMQNKAIPGFNKGKFETVVRGSKAENFNGKHIEKAPDLTLRRKATHPGIVNAYFDALFIECKLIEKGKTPLKYIEDGIRRFVVGDYAWAMPHAMMLAFVRDGKILPTALMHSYRRNRKKPSVQMCLPLAGRCDAESDVTPPQTYATRHDRPWEYKWHGQPGEIALYHIWLNCR